MAIVNVKGQTGGGGAKYATGTGTFTGSNGVPTTQTITGLGFRPYAVFIKRSTFDQWSSAICDDDGNLVIARGYYSDPYTPTFSATDDGFSLQYAGAYGQAYYWYALGL